MCIYSPICVSAFLKWKKKNKQTNEKKKKTPTLQATQFNNQDIAIAGSSLMVSGQNLQ